jgi:hypothetical protein
MHQVLPSWSSPGEALLGAIPRPGFDDDAAAADRRNVVAGGATGAVERRTESVFSGFDFREVFEAETEFGELRRRLCQAADRPAGRPAAPLAAMR